MKKFDLEKVTKVAKVAYYTTMIASSVVGIGLWLWWWKDCKKSMKEVFERVPENDFEDGEFIVNPNLEYGKWDDLPDVNDEESFMEWASNHEDDDFGEVPVDSIIKDFEEKLSEEIDNLTEDEEAALEQGIIHSKKWDEKKKTSKGITPFDE
nr:MAG TPA: hypothetical protein [Caudoviricetes sp.]